MQWHEPVIEFLDLLFEGPELTDFFQSPSDKLRLEMMLKSLSAGDLNLAILGDDEVALAFYARKIYEHLKTDPHAQVDLCLSADAEKLVQRFNQILSELTLDEALDKTIKTPQKRFLIFPDTQFIQDFELQLLARLINGLPASNLFVVLIFNKREPYEKKLQSFGKNLVQRVLESEHPSQGSNFSHAQGWNKPAQDDVMSAKDFKARQKSLLGASQSDDFLAQSPLGDKSGPYEVPSEKLDLGKSDPVLSEEELMAAVRSVQEQLDKEDLASKEAPPNEPPLRPKSSFLGWGLLVGLLISMGVLGAVYKDRIMEEMDSMKDYLEGPKWEKKSQEKSPVDASAGSDQDPLSKDQEAAPKEPQGKQEELAREKQPSVGMSSSTKSAIKLDDSLIPEKEAVLSAQDIKDKDKAKSKEDIKTALKLEAQKPEVAQSLSSAPESPSKPEIKVVPLPAGKSVVKEEPLKIPILKDATPVVPSKGASKEPKEPKEPKELVKEPLKEKVRSSEKSPPQSALPDASSAPGAIPKSDVQWVNALPEKSWVLQLAAMPNKADLQALKSSQAAFQDAKLLFTKNPTSGKTYYILIKGPIDSKEEAQSMMGSTPGLSSAWLRSSKSLKAQFKGN